MSTTGCLILHGLTNRRWPDHWQRHLAAALRRDGILVAYPQLPAPDDPALADWLDAAIAELELLREGGADEIVVVGHSLGAVTWLHAAAAGLVCADRMLLVAPPGPRELAERIPGFVLPPLTAGLVGAAAPDTRVVGSDADEWCAIGVREAYADPLGLDVDIVPGAAHFSLDDGFGRWPAVIAWAYDPAVRLTDDRS